MATIEDLGRQVKQKYPQYNDLSDIEVGRKTKSKFPQQYKDFTSQSPVKLNVPEPRQSLGVFSSTPEVGSTTGSKFLERLKLSFGDEEASQRAKQIEIEQGTAGKFDPGDIADLVGGSIPLIGTAIGSPFGLPGAAIGGGLGEAWKRNLGDIMGVRDIVTPKETLTSFGGTAAATLVGGKIGSYALSRIPKLLAIFTGERASMMSRVFKDPKVADEAIANGDAALRKAVEFGSRQSVKIKDAFIKGHNIAMGKIFDKAGVLTIDGHSIFTKFQDILKEKGVKFIGPKIDFTTSAIKANPGEAGKIKAAYEALQGWQDWSVQGTHKFLQLVGSLTKFATETGQSSKSPTLGSVYHMVNEEIKGTLPKNLRSAYSGANKKFTDNIDLFNEMTKVFNQGNPFSKLAGLFSENADSLRQIITFYEQKSGQKIFATVAGRSIAAERPAAFGFLNPRQWLDLFISPKAQASLVVKSSQVTKPLIRGVEEFKERTGAPGAGLFPSLKKGFQKLF